VRRLSLAAIPLLMSMTSGLAQQQSEYMFLWRAWELCVFGTAERYSKGSDSAPVLARAAMRSCQAERSRFAKLLAGRMPSTEATDTLLDIESTMLVSTEDVIIDLRSRAPTSK